ncbi:MAG TPA: SpoIIE family protein phosphatase [Conexibacter sp.]|nr:SpoIIE family protein phosphatase [Conexibacter sp.]
MNVPRRARRRTLPRDPSAVALARRTVEKQASVLSGEQLDVARLLVSELVTNAVRHGAGDEIALVTRVDGARLRFEVHDEGSRAPRRREPAGAKGGYGLNLVAALASRWGAAPGAGVWFELDREAAGAGGGGEQAAGPLEGTRSALAPPPWSRWLAAGVAATAALVVLDLVLGPSALLAALLVLPALGCALVARWGDTAAVAASGLALALAAPLWNDGPASTEVAALAVVAVGGTLAVLVALLRSAAEVNLRRFRLLSAIADVGNEAMPLEAAVARLLDMLTPAFADACVLDASVGGPDRRLGIRPRDAERAVADALDEEPGGARLVLPLRARGRTIGRLSALLCESGRRYSPSDVRFAEVFAGRAAVVLDNAGLTTELDAAERRLGTVLDGLAEAVTVMDARGRAVYANEAAVSLLRLDSVSELLDAAPGVTMERFEVYDEDGQPVDLRRLPAYRVLAGERDVEPLLVRNVVKATGEERWLVNKTTTITDVDGRVTRVVNVIEDVTETKRAELAHRLLAAASDALASSLDYEAMLQGVAEVAVPALADWCGVDVPGPGGFARLVAIAHAEPSKVALARRMRAHYPVPLDREQGIAAVMRDGSSLVHAQIADDELLAYAQDAQHFELLRELGMESLIVVPLVAGGQTLGTLTLARSTSGRVFDAADLELAEELARRAGIAALNARVYAERSAIAATLQRGLLPPTLQAPPGFAVATHYDAAGSMNEVGGDFYDAFPTDEGWMVVVGDVAGHGAEAAALTALARYTLRSAGQLTRDPVRAAQQLNATLRDLPQLSLCTAVCAQLRVESSERATLMLANCGHPQPLLLRDGTVRGIDEAGPIAGAFDDGEWTTVEIVLRAGDVLLLYTDGVLDTVGEHERFGIERLQAALEQAAGSEPDALVAGLAGALERFRHGPQRDDTAIVALGFEGVGARA